MRVFFAIWPTRSVAEQLAAWARNAHSSTGGRITRTDTIHLTLAFLGDVEEDRVDAAIEAARAIASAPFAIDLDLCAYWPHNRIVWVGTHAIPRALALLVDALRTKLGQAGFVLERRAFQAHVTLIRNAHLPSALPPFGPLAWIADEFVLVRSRLDPDRAGYEVLARFPLVSTR